MWIELHEVAGLSKREKPFWVNTEGIGGVWPNGEGSSISLPGLASTVHVAESPEKIIAMASGKKGK